MGRGVAKFAAAETAFEEADAVKTVVFGVFVDDAPEIVAGDAARAGVVDSFPVKDRGAAELSTQFGRNGIMIRSFLAVENHEVFGEDLTLILANVEGSLVIFGEGSKLLF